MPADVLTGCHRRVPDRMLYVFCGRARSSSTFDDPRRRGLLRSSPRPPHRANRRLVRSASDPLCRCPSRLRGFFRLGCAFFPARLATNNRNPSMKISFLHSLPMDIICSTTPSLLPSPSLLALCFPRCASTSDGLWIVASCFLSYN